MCAYLMKLQGLVKLQGLPLVKPQGMCLVKQQGSCLVKQQGLCLVKQQASCLRMLLGAHLQSNAQGISMSKSVLYQQTFHLVKPKQCKDPVVISPNGIPLGQNTTQRVRSLTSWYMNITWRAHRGCDW